jgi:hypothetical protein
VHVCVQTDVRYRCELTSLAWVLSLATAGNLLAAESNQTPGYARSLTRVQMLHLLACPLHSACHLPRVPFQKVCYSTD